MNPQRENQQRQLRILVADDQPDVCITLSALLEMEGYEVRCVGNGTAAVNAVRDFRPHVCILDLAMPEQSGYSVAGELRAMYGSRRPLLIAISGQWVKASEKLLAVSMGFDHFIAKPADPRQVLGLLEDVNATLEHT